MTAPAFPPSLSEWEALTAERGQLTDIAVTAQALALTRLNRIEVLTKALRAALEELNAERE